MTVQCENDVVKCSVGKVGDVLRFTHLWDISLTELYSKEITLRRRKLPGRSSRNTDGILLVVGCSRSFGAKWNDPDPFFVGCRFFDETDPANKAQRHLTAFLSQNTAPIRSSSGVWHPWMLKKFLQSAISKRIPLHECVRGIPGIFPDTIKADDWEIIEITTTRSKESLKQGTLFILHDYRKGRMRIGMSKDPVARAEAYRRDLETNLHLVAMIEDCPREMVRNIINDGHRARKNVFDIEPEDVLWDFIKQTQLDSEDWDEEDDRFKKDWHGPYGAWDD